MKEEKEGARLMSFGRVSNSWSGRSEATRSKCSSTRRWAEEDRSDRVGV